MRQQNISISSHYVFVLKIDQFLHFWDMFSRCVCGLEKSILFCTCTLRCNEILTWKKLWIKAPPVLCRRKIIWGNRLVGSRTSQNRRIVMRNAERFGLAKNNTPRMHTGYPVPGHGSQWAAQKVCSCRKHIRSWASETQYLLQEVIFRATLRRDPRNSFIIHLLLDFL